MCAHSVGIPVFIWHLISIYMKCSTCIQLCFELYFIFLNSENEDLACDTLWEQRVLKEIIMLKKTGNVLDSNITCMLYRGYSQTEEEHVKTLGVDSHLKVWRKIFEKINL